MFDGISKIKENLIMRLKNNSKSCKEIPNLRGNFNPVLGVIVIFSLGLYSCPHCTDMLCYGANDMGEFEMLNFSEAEVKSTFLVFYQKDSEFKIVEDSLRVYIAGSNDSTRFYGSTNKIISVEYDYKLYLSTINKVYLITNFSTFKTECNLDCFPKDYYYKVEGYEINGKYKESSVLKIDQLND